MTFSIGMRTVFRRENYCRNTLLRLVESGTLQHPSVVGLHVHDGLGLTPNANGIAALQLAARDWADWVIFLEDDIDIIDDFIPSLERWLAEFARPEILFYPLGSFYPTMSSKEVERGAWEMPLRIYYGSQALVFRTRDALSYAYWLSQYRGDKPDVSFDLHLTQWHAERVPGQLHVLSPSPCFVDHVGEHSLMGTWEQTGRILDFAGRDWSFRGRELEQSR